MVMVQLPAAFQIMREDINIVPTRQIEPGPCRQELETGFGDVKPAFPDQPGCEDGFELMQIQYIGRGIIQLRICEHVAGPVRALLLFGQINTQKLFAQIFETMSICICPDQARGDFRTEYRVDIDTEVALHDGHIEPREVENLLDIRIGHERLEVRAVIGFAIDLDDVGVTISGG